MALRRVLEWMEQTGSSQQWFVALGLTVHGGASLCLTKFRIREPQVSSRDCLHARKAMLGGLHVSH